MTAVIGAVLAGGLGTRIGGDKATYEVAGRPLLLHPLLALAQVCPRVVVVAKADSALPDLPAGVDVWLEPAEPRHPLTGITHALREAGGAEVLVCAVDLAALDAMTLAAVLHAGAAAAAADAVVPVVAGRRQPLCALYRPTALAKLAAAAGDARMMDAVAALDVAEVQFADGAAFANVNTPADADQVLRACGRSSVCQVCSFCWYSAGQRCRRSAPRICSRLMFL